MFRSALIAGFFLVLVMTMTPAMAQTCLDPVGSVDTPDDAEDVAVSGNLAYVVDSPTMSIIDISTPSSPFELAIMDNIWAKAIVVTAGYAYVANYYGLQVIDLSNPSSPTVVGTYSSPGYGKAVATDGGYAYLGNTGGNAGLRVVDVTSPDSPHEVADCVWWADIYNLDVSGGHVYMAGDGDLLICDISEPTDPVHVGTWHDGTTPPCQGVAVSGDYAYMACAWSPVLRVIDISTPSTPVEVASLDIEDWGAWNITVAGGYAYLTSRNSESSGKVVAVDITEPTTPTLVAASQLTTGTDAYRMDVARGNVFVASGDTGLTILSTCPDLPIFADGFENGTTSRWTSAVP